PRPRHEGSVSPLGPGRKKAHLLGVLSAVAPSHRCVPARLVAEEDQDPARGLTAPFFETMNDISAQGLPALVPGVNVLAIGVWNVDPTSTDLILIPRLMRDYDGAVIRGPYLQLSMPPAMTIRWRTDLPTNSRVRWGTDLNHIGWPWKRFR